MFWGDFFRSRSVSVPSPNVGTSLPVPGSPAKAKKKKHPSQNRGSGSLGISVPEAPIAPVPSLGIARFAKLAYSLPHKLWISAVVQFISKTATFTSELVQDRVGNWLHSLDGSLSSDAAAVQQVCRALGVASVEDLQDLLNSLVLAECVYKVIDHGLDEASQLAAHLKAEFPAGLVTVKRIQWALPHVQHRYLVAESDTTLFVAFMGTKQRRDLFTNANVLHEVVWDKLEESHSTEMHKGAPAAHRGFLRRARSIPIETLYAHAHRKGKKLVLCGHSLGGAVAMLCTLRLLQLLPKSLHNNVKCYGFATPAVGNASLSSLVRDAAWEHHLHNIVLPEDVIPRLLTFTRSAAPSSVEYLPLLDSMDDVAQPSSNGDRVAPADTAESASVSSAKAADEATCAVVEPADAPTAMPSEGLPSTNLPHRPPPSHSASAPQPPSTATLISQSASNRLATLASGLASPPSSAPSQPFPSTSNREAPDASSTLPGSNSHPPQTSGGGRGNQSTAVLMSTTLPLLPRLGALQAAAPSGEEDQRRQRQRGGLIPFRLRRRQRKHSTQRGKEANNILDTGSNKWVIRPSGPVADSPAELPPSTLLTPGRAVTTTVPPTASSGRWQVVARTASMGMRSAAKIVSVPVRAANAYVPMGRHLVVMPHTSFLPVPGGQGPPVDLSTDARLKADVKGDAKGDAGAAAVGTSDGKAADMLLMQDGLRSTESMGLTGQAAGQQEQKKGVMFQMHRMSSYRGRVQSILYSVLQQHPRVALLTAKRKADMHLSDTIAPQIKPVRAVGFISSPACPADHMSKVENMWNRPLFSGSADHGASRRWMWPWLLLFNRKSSSSASDVEVIVHISGRGLQHCSKVLVFTAEGTPVKGEILSRPVLPMPIVGGYHASRRNPFQRLTLGLREAWHMISIWTGMNPLLVRVKISTSLLQQMAARERGALIGGGVAGMAMPSLAVRIVSDFQEVAIPVIIEGQEEDAAKEKERQLVDIARLFAASRL